MLSSSSPVKIRKAKPGDARVLSQVFSQSWVNAYRGIIPHLYLDSMIRRRGTDWWRSAIRTGEEMLVLDVGSQAAGYATLGAARARFPNAGEIYEIYIAPDYQGLGFGEHLFEACRYHLDKRQLRGMVVWVLAENAGAVDFYWRRGGRPVASAIERFGPTRLQKIAFKWT